MSAALIQSVVSLPESPFPPLAVGFMGLGDGLSDIRPAGAFRLPGTQRIR